MSDLQKTIKDVRDILSTRKRVGTDTQMDVWVKWALDELEKATKCPDCGGSGVVEMSFDPYYAEPCVCTVDWMQETFKNAKELHNLKLQHSEVNIILDAYKDGVESLYQIIQRGDLTSFDLKQADEVLSTLRKEEAK